MAGRSVPGYYTTLRQADAETMSPQWARVLFSIETLPEEAGAQRRQMVQYLLPLIEQEQKQPLNNVLGTLVKAHEQGDEVLTQEEMLSFAMGLIIVGFETVSTTFGGGRAEGHNGMKGSSLQKNLARTKRDRVR